MGELSMAETKKRTFEKSDVFQAAIERLNGKSSVQKNSGAEQGRSGDNNTAGSLFDSVPDLNAGKNAASEPWVMPGTKAAAPKLSVFSPNTGLNGTKVSQEALSSAYLKKAAEDAQKEYENYLASGEYKAAQEAAKDKAWRAALAQGGNVSRNAAAKTEDETEKTLKAKAEYWKSQVEADEDRQLLSKDLKELESWSEADREVLKEYVSARDENQGIFTASNPFRWLFTNKEMAQKASALSEKYGEERVKELAESYARYIHGQDANALAADSAEAVSTVPGAIGHSALTVGAGILSGASGLAGRLGEANNRTGRFHTLEQYTPGDAFSLYSGSVRGATAENIEEGHGILGKVGSLVYQGAMSAADSAARLVLTGDAGAAAALAAANSYTGALSKYSAQGASPGEAQAMALTVASLEYWTEKIPLDDLLNISKNGGSLADVAKQAFVTEPATEELSMFGEILAEAAILREKSGYNQQIAELVANGASYEDAQKAANRDILMEAAETYATSAISAGISSGGAALYGNTVGKAGQDTQPAPETESQRLHQSFMEGMQEMGQQMPQVESAPAVTPEAQRVIEETMGTGQPERVDIGTMTGYDGINAQEGAGYDGTGEMDHGGVQWNPEIDPAGTAAGRTENGGGNVQSGDQGGLHGGVREGTLYTSDSEGRGITQQIDTGMDDETRYRILSAKEIRIVDDVQSANYADDVKNIESLPAKAKSKVEKIIRPLAEKLGILNRSLKSPAVEIEFKFSKNKGLKESLSKQLRYGGSYGDFAKALTNLDQILENAVLIEKHGDKYKGTTREDHRLESVSVLFGACRDGNQIIPVQMEIKKSSTNEGQLYVTVAMTKIEADVLGSALDTSQGRSLISASKCSLAELFQKINPADKHFLKYLPDGFLSEEQSEAKRAAIKEDMNRIAAYKTEQPELKEFGVSANDLQSLGQPETKSTPNAADREHGAVGAANPTTGMQSAPSGDIGKSRTFTNTGLNSADPDVREAYRNVVKKDVTAPEYQVKHNVDVFRTAQERTSTPEKAAAEYEYLMNRDAWTAEDALTADLTMKSLMKQEGKTAEIDSLARKIQQIHTNAGQINQSRAILGTMPEDTYNTIQAVWETIDGMTQEESTWNQTKNGPDFEEWKRTVKTGIIEIGSQIEKVADGDSAAMRDIIRQIAKSRKTTAWFGLTNRLSLDAQYVLNKLEFSDLKTVANAQLASMADDYRARTKGEIASGLRKQAMLSSIKTVIRNLGGNGGAGVLDSLSESGTGRVMDTFLSTITGKRTIGNDFKYAGTYWKGAWNACKFASLCIELNIPVETDGAASYAAAMGGDHGGKYVGKTFRANGNPAMRFMYAYQKYMAYALDASDKVFEGGTNAAVAASLESLKNANLTDTEISRLAGYTANRRTFKDATYEAYDKKGHPVTKGSALSRSAAGIKNDIGKLGTGVQAAADAAMPFVSVPMNVTQTGIDYSVGIAKGVREIASIVKDAKAGKEIDVNRQRQACSDFGRGVTGTALLGLFAVAAGTGVLRASDGDDWDKEYLEQSEGRSGAQFNWSALVRGFDGESTEWQDGDALVGLDFLEPFNTLMYLGYELAQEDSFKQMLKAYPGASVQSIYNAMMDSPYFTGLSDLGEMISDFGDAENWEERGEVLASYGGDAASSFIPQFVRQTAQYTDGYYRDTKGDTPAETAWNKIKAAIPGASESLPAKYDGLGQVQKRGGFASTFIDPTNTTTYHPNAITGYLDGLSQKTGDKSIYPESTTPMTVRVNGEEIPVSGKKMREAYSKTYGENVNALYSELMNNAAFSALPEELQAAGLKKANGYAKDFAKAAISDYDDIPEGNTAEIACRIVQETVNSQFTSAFSDLTDNWKDGIDDPDAESALENAYGLYDALPQEQKTVFREAAGGRVEYYLTAKENGVDTKTFTQLYRDYQKIGDDESLDTGQRAQAWAKRLAEAQDSGQITKSAETALKEEMAFRYTMTAETEKFDQMREAGIETGDADKVIHLLDGIVGTGSIDKKTGEPRVTDDDKWTEIAEANFLSDSEKDAVMKLYMTDYDPTAKSPDKTELRYDKMREEGFAPWEFPLTHAVTTQYTKKQDIINGFKALGYNDYTARWLYDLFKNSKKVLDVD